MQPALTNSYELALVTGDLSKLTSEERLSYYHKTCESLGLNPLTSPFDYISFQGKMKLYAKKDATDQLKKIHSVSIVETKREQVGDLFIVTSKAALPDGRTDEEIGVVSIANLKGDVLANAMMKANTKAKRRVVLSLCGLGWLDETEVETIPGAKIIEAKPVALPQPVQEQAAVKAPKSTQKSTKAEKVTHSTNQVQIVEPEPSLESLQWSLQGEPETEIDFRSESEF